MRTKRKPDAAWAYRYDPKKVWKGVNDRMVPAGGKAITAYGMRHTTPACSIGTTDICAPSIKTSTSAVQA